MTPPTIPIFTPCEYATMGQGERPILVDVFNAIRFSQLPGKHSFTLFARLLAEPGTLSLLIQAQRDGSQNVIDIFSAEIRVNDTQAHNLAVQEEFTFDQSGTYQFTLFVADQPLAQTHLTVSGTTPKEGNADESNDPSI